MAGYLGTPLAKKLGIRAGATILPISAPKEYRALLGKLAEDARFVTRPPKCGCELVHLFVVSRSDLECNFPKARAAIAPDGMIWVSWYKKSAKIPTDVTEDTIRNFALKGDLVDVKVCAVTDIWSGLKLVVRKALR